MAVDHILFYCLNSAETPNAHGYAALHGIEILTIITYTHAHHERPCPSVQIYVVLARRESDKDNTIVYACHTNCSTIYRGTRQLIQCPFMLCYTKISRTDAHEIFQTSNLFYQVSKPNSKKSTLFCHVIRSSDHSHFGQIDRKILVRSKYRHTLTALDAILD